MYVLLKPKTIDDKLLEPKRNNTVLEYIKQKLQLLETNDTPSANKATRKIVKILAKKTSNQNKLEQVNTAIKQFIFDYHKKRFIAFNKADVWLKTLLVWAGVGGFLLFGKIILDIAEQNDLTHEESYPLVFLSCIILFIVPVTFGLIWSFCMYAWFGVLKTIFSVLGFSSGKLARIQLIIEEHIISLKPGGRLTTIKFQGGIRI